ncbi:uncharacterized protein LOC144442021 [Glandiceps talaboti]
MVSDELEEKGVSTRGQESSAGERTLIKVPDQSNPGAVNGEKISNIADENDSLNQIISFSKKISKKYGYVILQFLNRGYVVITQNWICNVQCMGILPRTLFIATDLDAFNELQQFNSDVNVKLMRYDTQELLSFGQVAYYRFMLFRTLRILDLLQNDVSIFLCESDAVWLQNPMPLITKYSNLDIIVAPNEHNNPDGELSGGFCYLNATNATKKIWHAIYRGFESDMRKYDNDTLKIGWDNNDQALLNRVIKNNAIKVKILPDVHFVNGQWYRQEHIRNNTSPYVIQNNYVIGVANKIKRAKQWGHWYMSADDGDHCKTIGC